MKALPGLIICAVGFAGYVAVRGFNWQPSLQDVAAWMFLSMLFAGAANVLGALR